MRPFLHFSVHPRYVVVLFSIFAISMVAMRFNGGVADYLPPEKRTNGRETLAAFSPVTDAAKSTVVEVLSGEEVVALGTVVSPYGYIVTKESEVSDEPRVRLPDGQVAQGRVVAKDPTLDLALMIVPGAKLLPVRWGRSAGLKTGDWVVSPGQESSSWVGVVSAERREIKRVGGALGVSLGRRLGRRSGVEIVGVVADSPADIAGLEPGDEVLMVADRHVTSSQELISAIQAYDPGDQVTLRITRGSQRKVVTVELGFYSIFDPMNRNQQMSGETSDRRNGFPEVIQHVIPLTPNSMGSPLLNLRGETIGINIARADRVTSFAIPCERVIQSVQGMIGDLRFSQQSSLSRQGFEER